MDEPPSNAQVAKAVEFFAQSGLMRLLARLREKYQEVGHVGGQVVLEDSTPAERRNLASLLGKTASVQTRLTVRLSDVDAVLRGSGFACTLPDLLAASFPEQQLVTRQEQRAMTQVQQERFYAELTALRAALPEASRGHLWLTSGIHGLSWLYTRYKNTAGEEQQRQLTLIRYIAEALNQLPVAGAFERLALFAQRTSGNPHALDANTPAGRLFLLALADVTTATTFDEQQVQAGSDRSTTARSRSQEVQRYFAVGLLVDTISSTVSVYNLKQAFCIDGTPDPLIVAAGPRTLVLPLRQLLVWSAVESTRNDVYLLENPQVFEEVLDTLGSRSSAAPPTLICTAGWPGVAVVKLLDLLIAHNPASRLYYSGDFDVKGLQIAAYLLAHYPAHCQLWHFDPSSYQQALQDGGIPAPETLLTPLKHLPPLFAPLIAAIQEQGMWAYQEGIAHLLANDIERFPPGCG